jgi:hypothetical protein
MRLPALILSAIALVSPATSAGTISKARFERLWQLTLSHATSSPRMPAIKFLGKSEAYGLRLAPLEWRGDRAHSGMVGAVQSDGGARKLEARWDGYQLTISDHGSVSLNSQRPVADGALPVRGLRSRSAFVRAIARVISRQLRDRGGTGEQRRD